jgi:hypothetical protein
MKMITEISVVTDGINEEDITEENIEQLKKDVYKLIESESEKGSIITVNLRFEN